MSEIKIVEKTFPKSIEMYAYIGIFKFKSLFKKSYSLLYSLIKENSCNDKVPAYARYEEVDWKDQCKKISFFKRIYQLLTMKWHVYAGVEMDKEIQLPKGVIRKNEFSGKFLHTVHVGPYRKLNESYTRILNYAVKNDLDLATTSVELYMNDPAHTKSKDLITEMYIMLK